MDKDETDKIRREARLSAFDDVLRMLRARSMDGGKSVDCEETARCEEEVERMIEEERAR